MDAIELRIFNIEDREKMAAILVKNGYWVAQGYNEKGKSREYVLKIREDEANVQSTRK